MMGNSARNLLISLLLLLSANVDASLIINGSFEDSPVPKGSWRWFASIKVNGWQGSNIEIWNNLNGVKAAHGQQHIELNAHGYNLGPFSIYQDVETTFGQAYDVSFNYRARRNSSEAFQVALYSNPDNVVFSSVINDHIVSQWKRYDFSFSAIGDSMRLQFTSLVPSSATVGNFIDNITVSPQPFLKTSEVPDPNIFPVFLLIFCGLITMRLFR
jgi:hypothetical protein